MRPEVARDALLATHGGLSLELCAVIHHISPMALSRLVCAFGHHSLVMVLTRCGLALPTYFLADEKHSRCLTDKVYLPTIVQGRVLWHLGYTTEASAAAFTASYEAFQHAALQQEPAYRVRGILTDGFDSTVKSLRTLFPGARLGNCLRHAINKLPAKLVAIRLQCAKRYDRSSIPCYIEHASAKACVCLRWDNGSATLLTTWRTAQGPPTGNVSGVGCRTKRRAGMRSSPTRRCP